MAIFNFIRNIFVPYKDILQTKKNIPEVLETQINNTNYQKDNNMYLSLPPRQSAMFGGNEFCDRYSKLSLEERNNISFSEIMYGNVPDFMRKFCEVKITHENNNISIFVLPDYLSIGSNEDYVRIILSAKTSQKIADNLNCILPTKKMVDIIWKKSINKLSQNPMGPPYDATMWSMDRIKKHSLKNNLELGLRDKSLLTAGHKKDIIIDNALAPNNPKNRISIYGWHGTSGIPIQGPKPQSSAHSISFQDYSQGTRLVSRKCLINNVEKDIYDILNDKVLSYSLNESGVLRFKKY